jgi:hypothetical protein
MVDPELVAISKCTELLKELDDEAKIRVLQYLVNRYKLSPTHQTLQQTINVPQTVLHNQLPPPIKINEVQTANSIFNGTHPSLRDVVTKRLPKYETEWVLIYCYYASELGAKDFDREGIIAQYQLSKRWDLKTNKGLTNCISAAIKKDWIQSLSEGEFVMVDAGITYANEILNGNSQGRVRASTSRPGDSRVAKKNRVPIKTKTRIELKILSDLNLRPTDKISLKQFASGYTIKSAEELTLVIVYYLQEKLKLTVTLNHIYTCYRELGEKVPQFFKQTLTNHKTKKNWIDVEDWNNIKVTIIGTNYILHDLTKAVAVK